MQYISILNKITTPTKLAAIIGKHISTASRIMSGDQTPTTQEIGVMVENFDQLNPTHFFNKKGKRK